MSRNKPLLLSLDRLREVLHYEPATGRFTWTEKAPWKRHIGLEAGTVKANGYRYLSIDGVGYLAHRLAYFYVHGAPATHSIDHINGDRSDNRLANLRDVTPRTNSQNRKRANADNKLGLLGVRPVGTRFRAQIRINGRVTTIGCFDDPKEAHFAYLDAKRKHHEGCTI